MPKPNTGTKLVYDHKGPPVPQVQQPKLSPGVVFKQLQTELMHRVRALVKAGPFSVQARKSLARSLNVQVQGSRLTLTTSHPAWKPLIQGMRPGAMTSLLKAKAPIPIVLENGQVIFRPATPKSFLNGSWRHPGHKPTDLLSKIQTEAKVYIKQRMAQELARELRKAFRVK